MAKIVVSENVTLDGVVEDPTGEAGFRHGGWFNESGGEDLGAWARAETAEALRAEALLIGRRSYEYFAERFPSRSGEWADKFNSMPKYVVSASLEDPEWGPATVLKGDIVDEVSRLKRKLEGEIVVYASRPLVHTLMEHDLVDEVRLIVFPVVLGDGERIFGETREKRQLRLIETKTIGDGLAFLTYEVVH